MYMASGYSALFFKSNTSPVSSSKVETGLANTWNLLGYFEIPACFLAMPDMFVSEEKIAI